MNIKHTIDPKDYEVGVIIGRFQTPSLHQGHINLIKAVVDKHEKAILLLGLSRIQNTKKNPYSFAIRRLVIQNIFPNLVILPIDDQRLDEHWSENVDKIIKAPFGEAKIVLYGSRDSFIGRYTGKHPVIELETIKEHNSTELRNQAGRTIKNSEEWREGVIFGIYSQRPVTYPTVDVCVYNEKGEILLARKPREKKWRFVGGFVDRTDASYEDAAYRELHEETGGNLNVGIAKDFKYVLSHKVNDWRYNRGEDSGIMTILFLVKRQNGYAKASDDIADVEWFSISKFLDEKNIEFMIIEEHQEMLAKLVEKVYRENLIPNISESPKLRPTETEF